MPIYRVKVPRCLDAVAEAPDPSSLVEGLRGIIELCGNNTIYVHLLEPGPRELVEKERVLAIGDKPSSHDQP